MKELSLICKVIKLVNLPNVEGSDDVNRLKPKRNCVRWGKLPKSGRVPEKEFETMLKVSAMVKSLSPGGIVPVRQLVLRSNKPKKSGEPRVLERINPGGMDDVNKLACRSK